LICTEVGSGTSFVNRHGETGLVVPPRDPAALAAAINTLLADPDRRRVMGRAAQKRVREQFTVEQMIAQVEALYRQLLDLPSA
ncbi:MAG: glycosyltransferase, partial [Chloroflexi bacterium]